MENSDDDSISLPSSDDDDDDRAGPMTANFFPPLSWSFESRSHSLDDDQQSSKSVPNAAAKPLMPINACYDFVRKALRRLSSANSTDEDASLMEKLQRVDSAVPPSPSHKMELTDVFALSMVSQRVPDESTLYRVDRIQLNNSFKAPS